MFTKLPSDKTMSTEHDVVNRALNLVGKICKAPEGKRQVAASTAIHRKLLDYFCSDVFELHKSALIAFHCCCVADGYRDLCLKKHGVDENLSQFDKYIKKAIEQYMKAYTDQNWDYYVNICASISGFAGIFPEKQIAFKSLIIPLIKVMGDKIDVVRRNSAVLIAKLTQNEENKKWMQENHGTEVLLSL